MSSSPSPQEVWTARSSCCQHWPLGIVMENCCHHCWKHFLQWLKLTLPRLVNIIAVTLGSFLHNSPSLPSLLQSPSLLPFLLHLQSLHPSPDSKLAIFYSIPRLATHKLATVGVVNTLQVLGGNPFLIAMATRLMGKVWQLQDHIFPQLKGLLSKPPPLSTPPAITREIALARSAVIRDICCYRYWVNQEGYECCRLVHIFPLGLSFCWCHKYANH